MWLLCLLICVKLYQQLRIMFASHRFTFVNQVFQFIVSVQMHFSRKTESVVSNRSK